jgi:hypothetical protein
MSALSADFIDPLRYHLSIVPNAACWVLLGFAGNVAPSLLGITSRMAC